jgi:pimeloyl-ACP methyl ester carboxylesterase
MTVAIDILQILGIIVGLFALYLLVVAVAPGISVPKQPLEKTGRPGRPLHMKPPPSRKDVRFEVGGVSIAAWLYLPESVTPPAPCIVMGHGFGGTKDMGLESYAVRFVEAGCAVLAFDYRHFGESEGEPRQLVWIPYQLEDYQAAIDYARGLDGVDAARIALWGTSLSGGHVVVTAVNDQDVACVIAQCPGLDGLAAVQMHWRRVSVGYGLRMVMHGQRDLVRSWLGLSPHRIPIVGGQGTVACMTTPDAYDFFKNLESEGFINEVCARINIRGDKYRPVKKASKVRCPVLLQICDFDTLTPIGAAEETANRLGKLASVKRYPVGHFDVYSGADFERSVVDQLHFLEKNLLAATDRRGLGDDDR